MKLDYVASTGGTTMTYALYAYAAYLILIAVLAIYHVATHHAYAAGHEQGLADAHQMFASSTEIKIP